MAGPEVVLHHNLDRAMAGGALNQFERHACGNENAEVDDSAPAFDHEHHHHVLDLRISRLMFALSFRRVVARHGSFWSILGWLPNIGQIIRNVQGISTWHSVVQL